MSWGPDQNLQYGPERQLVAPSLPGNPSLHATLVGDGCGLSCAPQIHMLKF